MKTCGIRVFSTDCLCSSWACLLEPRSPPVAAWEGHPGVNFPPNDSGGDLEWLSVLCLKTVVVQVLSLFIFERQREIRWVQGTHWDAGPTLQGPLLLKKPGLKQPELWNPRRLHGLHCWAACLPVDSTYCKVSHFSKLDQGWKFTPFFPPEANGILKPYCNRYFNSCEKDVML